MEPLNFCFNIFTWLRWNNNISYSTSNVVQSINSRSRQVICQSLLYRAFISELRYVFLLWLSRLHHHRRFKVGHTQGYRLASTVEICKPSPSCERSSEHFPVITSTYLHIKLRLVWCNLICLWVLWQIAVIGYPGPTTHLLTTLSSFPFAILSHKSPLFLVRFLPNLRFRKFIMTSTTFLFWSAF